jgi:MscS family membrane protein
MKRWLLILLQVLILAGAIYMSLINAAKWFELPWRNFISPVLMFIIFVTSAKLILGGLELVYRRRDPATDPKKDNIILGLRNVFYILFALAFILLVLSLFGIDYKTLFTTLSIVAAAIAIVTKEFLADVLSGVFMSFSGNLRIDDYVKIGEAKGKILDMGLQKVTFLNDDDDVTTIPNYKVYQSEIINYTLGNQRRMSIDFQIGLQNIDDIESLEEDLIENLEEYRKYIEKGSYNLKVVHLTKDYLDLKFQYTLKNLDRNIYREIRRNAARRVLNFVKSTASDDAPATDNRNSAQ